MKMNFALNNLQWLICHKTQPKYIQPNKVSYELCSKGNENQDVFTKNDL